jgi:hypothetical protein
MAKQIFREEAMNRLASTEQLDRLMPVTQLRGWIALGGVSLILLAAVLWGTLGKVATKVEARGVLTRLKGVKTIYAPVAGRVGKVSVHKNDMVDKDDLHLLDITPTPVEGTRASVAVNSPVAGRIVEVAVDEGVSVDAGAVLVVLESLEQPLKADVFVPLSDAYYIKEHMGKKRFPVEITLVGDDRPNSRGRKGLITSARNLPATRATMLYSIPHEGLVEMLLKEGLTLEMIATLEEGDWMKDIYSGTPCRAMITIKTQRPYQLIFSPQD